MSLPFNNYSENKWTKLSNQTGLKQKQYPFICYLQETHFTNKDRHRLKVKEYKKILHDTAKEKWVGVAILISDKLDLKSHTKKLKARQRRPLHNDQWIDLTVND